MRYVTGLAGIQGSAEWHELRRTKIGASSSPAILGLSPHKTAEDVFKEMAFGERTYVNKAMQHGSDTEDEARQYFNQVVHFKDTDNQFKAAVVISEEYHIMMASLDGINAIEDTVLEIKVPGKKVYDSCAKGNIPIHWEYQIQHQLAVTGLDKAILFVYLDPTSNLEFTYGRNEDRIKEIVRACKEFEENNLLTFKSPGHKEDAYTERHDREWGELVTSYLQYKKEGVAAKEKEQLYRQKLIDLSNGECVKGCGVCVEKREVKGPIDYALAEEIENINLEQYRLPSKIQWRICETE